jgi:hypothetical protein
MGRLLLPPWRWRMACIAAASTAAASIHNQRDTYLPDLLICRPEHAPRVLAEIAALAAA